MLAVVPPDNGCATAVVLEENGNYRVTAAGPTTSIREEPYQADVI